MKVLVVSGIWPPDVGGPASHAPELAAWLRDRGHAIEVVTTAGAPPPPAGYPVHWVSRRLPAGVRHLAVVSAIARRARKADVVYATSMLGRTAVGSAIAGRPFVAKVTTDSAFERARRRLGAGAEVSLGGSGGGVAAAVLRRARDWSLRRASHVLCPSSYIAGLAATWRGGEGGVSVVPNPAPSPHEAASVGPQPARPFLVFAGRLTGQKNLDLALAAMARVPDVRLVVAGEGEERARLEARAAEQGLDGRVSFAGALPRAEVLALLGAADLAVLPSAWENFPHAAVEALAMGTPVVATRVGGVPEIVEDGVNGLLVEPGDEEAFAGALQRLLDDDALRARFAAAAAPSVQRFRPDAVYGEIERILADATR